MSIQLLLASPLNQVALRTNPSPKDSLAKIRHTAIDFEALLLTQMLKTARESGGGGLAGDGDADNPENSTMIELGEQQFAQALAGSGGLGIAKMVVAGLTKHADR
jgi:Rod binding domain-containing protein